MNYLTPQKRFVDNSSKTVFVPTCRECGKEFVYVARPTRAGSLGNKKSFGTIDNLNLTRLERALSADGWDHKHNATRCTCPDCLAKAGTKTVTPEVIEVKADVPKAVEAKEDAPEGHAWLTVAELQARYPLLPMKEISPMISGCVMRSRVRMVRDRPGTKTRFGTVAKERLYNLASLDASAMRRMDALTAPTKEPEAPTPEPPPAPEQPESELDELLDGLTNPTTEEPTMNAPTTPTPAVAAASAPLPRPLSHIERRKLLDKLFEVYDMDKFRYRGDMTDEKLSIQMGIPRAHVAQMRHDFMGGPDTNEAATYRNERVDAMDLQIKALEKKLQDLTAEITKSIEQFRSELKIMRK